MKYIVIAFLLVITAFPLAAQKKMKILTDDVRSEVKNKKVLVTYYESPKIWFMTPKDALVDENGSSLISTLTKSNIADDYKKLNLRPSKEIHEKALGRLQTEGFLIDVATQEPLLQPIERKKYDKAYPDIANDIDYILEFSTAPMGFSCVYGTIKWSTYTMRLGVVMNLIDAKTKKLIWRKAVGHSGKKEEGLKFHIKDLKVDDGEKIFKDKVSKITDIVADLAVEAYKASKK